ncbi:hypothetical protein WN943_013160 [Citrus x changshan-huyou]
MSSYSREGRAASPHNSVSPRRGQRSRSLSRSRRSRSRSRSRSPDAANPGNNLYVTGLSTRVTNADLEKFFGGEGKVTECHLVTDPRTRESRGFAFVTMETVEGADRCIKYLNRSVLEGRLITVEKVALAFLGSAYAYSFEVLSLTLSKEESWQNTNSWPLSWLEREAARYELESHVYGNLMDTLVHYFLNLGYSCTEMVVDVLVAIPPTDITEILIQGTGEEDHVPHMVEEDHDPHMLQERTSNQNSNLCNFPFSLSKFSATFYLLETVLISSSYRDISFARIRSDSWVSDTCMSLLHSISGNRSLARLQLGLLWLRNH